MSSMHIGGATVAVIHASRGGMNCEAFPSKLAAVLRMIDLGDLGGGIFYGCDEHKAALAEVEKQISATRASIAEMEAEDATADSVQDMEPGQQERATSPSTLSDDGGQR